MWPFRWFIRRRWKRRVAPDGTVFIDWDCGCVTIKHVSRDGTGTRKKRVPCEKHTPRKSKRRK
jgi:hypothetical protein